MIHNGCMTVRRLKTYTGAQGYVYQYYFVGKRAALADDPEAPATEFIFDVTSDRKLTYAISVFLPESPVAAWSQGLAPARTRIVPGAAHAMAIYFDLRDELLEFLRSALLLR